MRILQINAYYGYGSTGSIVKNIEKRGQEEGMEMYSVYWLNRDTALENRNVYYCGREKGKSAYWKMAQWVFAGGRIRYNTDVTRRIVAVIENLNPHIIHLHNLHGDFEYGMLDIPLLFECIAETKAKVIWTLHDCWPLTGRCYYFWGSRCERWKCGCGKCPQRFYDREGILRDYTKENWNIKKELYSRIEYLKVITVSKWLEGVTSESMFSKRPIQTIYNGINQQVFFPTETERSNRRFTIMCTGWDRRKGYKDYYELSKLLQEDEEILVVGERPFFRSFRKMPHNIRTIPYVNNMYDMAEVYRNADVYFNSSVAETFGLTTAEAMSCGIPVVGYKSTATPEVVGDSMDYGICVSPGNVTEVYAAIERIKKASYDNILEKKKKRHGRVKNNFELERMLDEYIRLYKC